MTHLRIASAGLLFLSSAAVIAQSDFGDAPPSYGSASHDLATPYQITLGSLVDAEPSDQASLFAEGDDLNLLQDEDGVALGPLIIGQPFWPMVAVKGAGPLPAGCCFVNAWVDYNGDGAWGSSEQILIDAMMVPNVLPPAPLPALMPSNSALVGITFARFRLTSIPLGAGAPPAGPLPDGEVEDYLVQILPPGTLVVPTTISATMTPVPTNVDEPGGSVTYDIMVSNLGPSPVMLIGLVDSLYGPLDLIPGSTCAPFSVVGMLVPYTCSFSGNVSGEPGMVNNSLTVDAIDSSSAATAGLAQASVTINNLLPTLTVTKSASRVAVATPGQNVTFTVQVQNTTFEALNLDSLIDDVHGNLNGQGTCAADPATPIAVAGSLSCSYSAPVLGAAGTAQVSTVTATVSDNDGSTANGVDSVSVAIVSNVDYGDAPPPYATLAANQGARHTIDGTNYLGLIPPDAEADGQPLPDALGDDLTDDADEDGADFGPTATFEPGTTGSVNITLSGNCLVSAWIDFDRSGIWGDSAGEQIFMDLGLPPAAPNTLGFSIPASAPLGDTYARVRCSLQPGITPIGLDPTEGGEVEDYKITIADLTPPLVADLLSTPSGLGLSGCPELRSAPTRLVIDYSEAMDDSLGLLSDSASYTLRGSGKNGLFDSATCDPLSADDQSIPMLASYSDGSAKGAFLANQSRLDIDPSAFAGNTSQELFRLELCGAFTDLAGNPLTQPPAKGLGAVFSRVFRVELLNPFTDGNFDCGVVSWTPTGSPIVFDSSLDHQISPDSGSLLMSGNGGGPVKGAGDSATVAQCLDVPGDRHSDVSYRYRVNTLSSVDAFLQCSFWSTSNCGGPTNTGQNGSFQDQTNFSDSASQWVTHTFAMAIPAATVSARCTIGAQDTQAGQGFDVYFDALKIDLDIFRDGFESP